MDYSTTDVNPLSESNSLLFPNPNSNHVIGPMGPMGPMKLEELSLSGQSLDTKISAFSNRNKSITTGFTFKRVATFPVFQNQNPGDIDIETVAEIVDVTEDGNTLIYTDSETENIGFVDITDIYNPQPDGLLGMGGEPTSVAVAGPYALVAVNTSEDFVNPSGTLKVVNVNSRAIVEEIDLGGQPDSAAVSPDGRYAAIAIENKRDEDLGDGSPPQLPAGFVVIVDLLGTPDTWMTRTVELVGVPDLFPEDPEPEYVDINRKNEAVVTLQENNHIVVIDLKKGKVKRDWSAGSVALDHIDIKENDLIELNGSLSDVPREPDGVTWMGPSRIATADEGDLFGGSRGFTTYRRNGSVDFNSGNSVEHTLVRLGHYPENRSENKGNEPEAVEFGIYNNKKYLFVGSERSNAVLVYQVQGFKPELIQVLPTGVGPEGVKAIPERNLLAVASEVDDRGDKIRSSITLYELSEGPPTYPTVYSANRDDGLPIPWGALSALAADRNDSQKAYTVYDSFYQESRIFELDLSTTPPVITSEIVLNDGGATVNLDLEGISTRSDGGFWVVSEGAGSVDDLDRPVTSNNTLYQIASNGTILETIELPEAVNDLQRRFGFEGVASVDSGDDELVYVAFQREWVGDPEDHVRIGRYEVSTEEWTFFYYPIDDPTSPNGGWVGLSEIVALDDESFAVIERDNQAGTDATIKKIYRFSIDGLTPQPQGETFPVVTKELVRDLIPDLLSDNGAVLEKVEGLAVLKNGDTIFVTDNDGVDDSSGETQLQNLGPIFDEVL